MTETTPVPEAQAALELKQELQKVQEQLRLAQQTAGLFLGTIPHRTHFCRWRIMANDLPPILAACVELDRLLAKNLNDHWANYTQADFNPED